VKKEPEKTQEKPEESMALSCAPAHEETHAAGFSSFDSQKVSSRIFVRVMLALNFTSPDPGMSTEPCLTFIRSSSIQEFEKDLVARICASFRDDFNSAGADQLSVDSESGTLVKVLASQFVIMTSQIYINDLFDFDVDEKKETSDSNERFNHLMSIFAGVVLKKFPKCSPYFQAKSTAKTPIVNNATRAFTKLIETFLLDKAPENVPVDKWLSVFTYNEEAPMPALLMC